MDLELTETQQLIQKTARDFATRRVAPGADERDKKEQYPEELMRGLAELGLLGVNIDPKYGGAGAGVVSYALAMWEISKACASTGVSMAVASMVAEVIAHFGTEAQRELHVAGITSGDYVSGSFALSEAEAGSDPGSMRTTARRDGNEWVINGQKQWITNGDYAGVTIVWARTGEPGTKGISCFLVPKGTPGLTVGKKEDKMGLRASNTVPLTFDDCRVPLDALLADEGMGFRIAMMALDGGRIGIASQAIGIAMAAHEAAAAYSKEREAFGKTISNFQAIQWMLADDRVELDAAKMLCLRAAAMKEANLPLSKEASMAKVFASEAAVRICNRAMQVLGGYGYIREFPVERYLRDVRVTTIYEGTSQIQRIVIARELLRS